MKICVGLSGGVDSSVAALLLKQQGYDVFAMFMQNWHDTEGTLHGDCEWEEDRFVAEMVARKIGIPFYFIDLSHECRQRVVDYMFDEYARGRTPNPDVLCNREIKFDAFLNAARRLGADFVATGHYCRKDAFTATDGRTVYRILAGEDSGKDQSYFLCQLTQEQLAQALFPIGDLDKAEVRRLAAGADLPSADKKDSQGICFVGKVDLPVFLQQKLASVEGDVVEVFDAWYADNPQYQRKREILDSLTVDGCPARMVTDYTGDNDVRRSVHGVPEHERGCDRARSVYDLDKVRALSDEDLKALAAPLAYDLEFETEVYRSGKKHLKKTRWKPHPYGVIVGRHEGAQFYTIGQRKGLGVGGHAHPLFVIGTDIVRNRVYVGEGHTHKGLSSSCVRIAPEDIHWIREDLRMELGQIRRYRVRVRYRQPLQDALLILRSSGLYILFDDPQRGVSAGQFAVWYDRDEMIGSGVL